MIRSTMADVSGGKLFLVVETDSQHFMLCDSLGMSDSMTTAFDKIKDYLGTHGYPDANLTPQGYNNHIEFHAAIDNHLKLEGVEVKTESRNHIHCSYSDNGIQALVAIIKNGYNATNAPSVNNTERNAVRSAATSLQGLVLT